MSALMTLTVTTHTPPLSRDAVEFQRFREPPSVPQPMTCIAVAYRRFATGQCYERGLRVSRRGGTTPAPQSSPEQGTWNTGHLPTPHVACSLLPVPVPSAPPPPGAGQCARAPRGPRPPAGPAAPPAAAAAPPFAPSPARRPAACSLG